jgi:hypothetical protein
MLFVIVRYTVSISRTRMSQRAGTGGEDSKPG